MFGTHADDLDRWALGLSGVEDLTQTIYGGVEMHCDASRHPTISETTGRPLIEQRQAKQQARRRHVRTANHKSDLRGPFYGEPRE